MAYSFSGSAEDKKRFFGAGGGATIGKGRGARRISPPAAQTEKIIGGSKQAARFNQFADKVLKAKLDKQTLGNQQNYRKDIDKQRVSNQGSLATQGLANQGRLAAENVSQSGQNFRNQNTVGGALQKSREEIAGRLAQKDFEFENDPKNNNFDFQEIPGEIVNGVQQPSQYIRHNMRSGDPGQVVDVNKMNQSGQDIDRYLGGEGGGGPSQEDRDLVNNSPFLQPDQAEERPRIGGAAPQNTGTTYYQDEGGRYGIPDVQGTGSSGVDVQPVTPKNVYSEEFSSGGSTQAVGRRANASRKERERIRRERANKQRSALNY